MRGRVASQSSRCAQSGSSQIGNVVCSRASSCLFALSLSLQFSWDLFAAEALFRGQWRTDNALSPIIRATRRAANESALAQGDKSEYHIRSDVQLNAGVPENRL